MLKWWQLLLIGLSLKVNGWLVYAYLSYVTDGFEHMPASAGFAFVLFLVTNCIIAVFLWLFIPEDEL